MTFQDFTYAVQSIGFPIAVAWFVLAKMNGRMDRLTKELTSLREAVIELKEWMRKA